MDIAIICKFLLSILDQFQQKIETCDIKPIAFKKTQL